MKWCIIKPVNYGKLKRSPKPKMKIQPNFRFDYLQPTSLVSPWHLSEASETCHRPQTPVSLLTDPAFHVFNNREHAEEGRKRQHDLRKDSKPGFRQLSWQDLTPLLVTPEVPPEDSHQERKHVLTVGTLNTRARSAVKTCPSLHPSCQAQFVRRWVAGGGDCPQLWRK